MSLSDKKGEILRLIEKLQPQPGRSLSLADRVSRQAPSAVGDKISKRRREITDLRTVRERMAIDLFEERVLGICQTLEQRIGRIEIMIRQKEEAESKTVTGGAQNEIYTAESLLNGKPEVPKSPDMGGVVFGQPPATGGALESAPQEAQYTLSGEIQEGVLSDILQFLSTNRKTGAFIVKNDGPPIAVYLEEGQIVHAVAGDISGESAIFAMMSMCQGRFHFDESEELPEERTITGNLQFIILEALRQIDEAGGGE